MNKKQKKVRILTYVYLMPLFAIMAFNTALSFVQTTYMETGMDNEIPLYKADAWWFVLLGALLFLGLLYYAQKKTDFLSRQHKKVHYCCLGISCLLCIAVLVVFKATASCDSATVIDLAVSLKNGDYSAYTGDGYLVHYPHQIGFIKLLQLVFRVFGDKNYLVCQIGNLICILGIEELLIRISYLLFQRERVMSTTAILCACCAPLFMYVTFIYGDIPGLALGLLGLYLTLLYLQKGKWVMFLAIGVAMGASLICKSNNLVLLIGVAGILVLKVLEEKDWQNLVGVALVVILAIGISKIPSAMIMKEAGLTKYPAGNPKLSWIAMGLQENDYLEDGWYNSYNWNVYANHNYDSSEANKACVESIKDSLRTYVTEPRRGLRFFYNKFRSQWNDPGFQSQITNEWYSRHQNHYSDIYNWVVFGKGKLVLEWIMNIYQFMILLGSSVAVFKLIGKKEWSLSRGLLPLCIFGGFLFHMFWEAQGRYALPYFILMIPLAGFGLTKILQKK